MTDSTTSAGWLQKSNFLVNNNDEGQVAARITIARTHARLYMNHQIREYSQWFPGKHNNVADALSRDFYLSDDELTLLILNNFPTQVPHSFHIVPLPSAIVSWMTSWLLMLPVKAQFREVHTPTTLGLGSAGPHTANPSAWPTTSTSHDSPNNNKHSSLEPSVQPFAPEDIREALQVPWLLQQSAVPSITWLRPSPVTAGQTQHETVMDN